MAIYRVQRLFSISERLFGLSNEIKMVMENIRRLNASGGPGSKKLIAEQQAKLSKMQESLKRRQLAGKNIAIAKKEAKLDKIKIDDLTTQKKGTRSKKAKQELEQQINTLRTDSQGKLDQAMENLQALKGSAPVNDIIVNYTGKTTRNLSNPFQKKPKITIDTIGNDKLTQGRFNKPGTSTPTSKGGSTPTTGNTPTGGSTPTTGNTPTGGSTPTTGNTPTGGSTPTTGNTPTQSTTTQPQAGGSWWSKLSETQKGGIIGTGGILGGAGLTGMMMGGGAAGGAATAAGAAAAPTLAAGYYYTNRPREAAFSNKNNINHVYRRPIILRNF